MRGLLFKGTCALGLIVIIMTLLFFGCGKKATDPEPVPVEPKEYIAYFGCEQPGNKVFAYNTTNGELDSFDLPYNILESGLAVSPDGETMYLAPDGYIVEVSLDSQEVVAEHPTGAVYGTGGIRYLHISPEGKYLAISLRRLYLFDLNDFSIVYEDTADESLYFRHNFTLDSKTLLYSHAIENYGLDIVEVNIDNNFSANRRKYNYGHPRRIIASTDNRLWYLYSIVGPGTFRIQVYDKTIDSLIYGKTICPGYGDLEITHDGEYLIYSQPGNMQMHCIAPQYFTIFDIANNEIYKQVDVFEDTLYAVFNPNELCITPDGNHLIGTSQYYGQLFDYNLETEELTRIAIFGGQRPLSLTCQSQK
ncbi:MAG: hypothetical protein ABIE07_09550 [Candidatus Zixiibacteriota bacterium]